MLNAAFILVFLMIIHFLKGSRWNTTILLENFSEIIDIFITNFGSNLLDGPVHFKKHGLRFAHSGFGQELLY